MEAAWAEEIKRRVDEIRSGKVKMVPGEQVLREMADEFPDDYLDAPESIEIVAVAHHKRKPGYWKARL